MMAVILFWALMAGKESCATFDSCRAELLSVKTVNITISRQRHAIERYIRIRLYSAPYTVKKARWK